MKQQGSSDGQDISSDVSSLTLASTARGSRVLVAGELDMATANELEGFVRTALAAGPPSLTLDLSDVTFIDSFGVRALVLTARQASSLGIAFSVFCPYANQRVRRVLGILQLSSMMAIVAADTDGSAQPEPQRGGPVVPQSGAAVVPQSAKGLIQAYEQIEQVAHHESPKGAL